MKSLQIVSCLFILATVAMFAAQKTEITTSSGANAIGILAPIINTKQDVLVVDTNQLTLTGANLGVKSGAKLTNAVLASPTLTSAIWESAALTNATLVNPVITLSSATIQAIRYGQFTTAADGTITNSFGVTVTGTPIIITTPTGASTILTNQVVSSTTTNFIYTCGAAATVVNWVMITAVP